MDCHGQWISLTTVKFSCQDQAQQRTETPANRLSSAVSIVIEPWVHRSKGMKRVHITSCLDFHGFINLFSHEGKEPAEEKPSVHSFSSLSWGSPWRRKLRAHQSLQHSSFMKPCIGRCAIPGVIQFVISLEAGDGHIVDFLLCPAAYLH